MNDFFVNSCLKRWFDFSKFVDHWSFVCSNCQKLHPLASLFIDLLLNSLPKKLQWFFMNHWFTLIKTIQKKHSTFPLFFHHFLFWTIQYPIPFFVSSIFVQDKWMYWSIGGCSCTGWRLLTLYQGIITVPTFLMFYHFQKCMCWMNCFFSFWYRLYDEIKIDALTGTYIL